MSKVKTHAKLWTPHCAEQMGSWEGSDLVLQEKGDAMMSKDMSLHCRWRPSPDSLAPTTGASKAAGALGSDADAAVPLETYLKRATAMLGARGSSFYFLFLPMNQERLLQRFGQGSNGWLQLRLVELPAQEWTGEKRREERECAFTWASVARCYWEQSCRGGLCHWVPHSGPLS